MATPKQDPFAFFDQEEKAPESNKTPLFTEDEPSSSKLDLVKLQQGLLASALSITAADFERVSNKTGADPDEYEESDRVKVGDVSLDSSLFTFKVLVYDDQIQKIIAPIFKVGDLRDCNVVLHTNINAAREPCPGLPAVYLVEPTADNMKLIASDCQRNLYDFVFISFTSQPIEADLDTLAIELTRAKASHKICRVGYEHLGGFQVISSDFFNLFCSSSNFVDLYQCRNEDAIVSQISKNLYEAFICMKVFPLIRTDEGEDPINLRIAQHLVSLMSSYASNPVAQVSKPKTSQRALLVLFNRKKDIQSMLYHSWKYLSQIHDIFQIKNNSFEFRDDEGKLDHYELDFQNDSILSQNAFTGFHQAGPNVHNSLSEWKKDYEKFGGAASKMDDISSDLTTAIDKLPQMTEQKKKVDMHVKLATRILENIKARSLDKLQDIEDEIMTTRSLAGENKDDLVTFLQKDQPESFTDKVRVLLIMILCFNSKVDEISDYLEMVAAAHPTPEEGEVLQKVRIMFQKKQAIVQKKKENEDDGSSYGFMRSFTKGLATGLSKMLTDQNNQQAILARSVKQIIGHVKSKYQSPGVKYLDTFNGSIIEMPDPATVSQVVAFSIGGGSFYEYETLKTTIEQADLEEGEQRDQMLQGTKVVYGCDFCYSPSNFLEEILKLN